MLTKKNTTVLIIALLVANLLLLCFMAFRPHPSKKRIQGGPERHGPKQLIIDRLDFSEDQSELFSVLVRAHRDATFKFDEKIKIDKKYLFSLLEEITPNIVIVDSLTSSIAKSQKQIEQLHFNHFKKVKALCKDEQIEKFNALIKDLARLFDRKRPLPNKKKQN